MENHSTLRAIWRTTWKFIWCLTSLSAHMKVAASPMQENSACRCTSISTLEQKSLSAQCNHARRPSTRKVTWRPTWDCTLGSGLTSAQRLAVIHVLRRKGISMTTLKKHTLKIWIPQKRVLRPQFKIMKLLHLALPVRKEALLPQKIYRNAPTTCG